MSVPRTSFSLLILALTAASLHAQSHPASHPARQTASASKTGSQTESASSAPQSLLPKTFAGWQITGTPDESTQASTADPGDAVPLQEYGFARYESARYTRDDGEVTVKAMEFADATGAYGAFTFYRRPTMSAADIGSGAAFDGKRVLFWSGISLVDAIFQHITPMSAGELRDLVNQLPKALGNQATPPRLPDYLPHQHLEQETVKYAIGPQSYVMSGGVLPPGLVDFGRSAEVVTAEYNALGGTGTLTIVNYPDSEIAIDRQHAIQAYFASHGSPQYPWTPALTDSNPSAIQLRRSGPLLAISSGSYSGGAANELLQRVHYEEIVTLGHQRPHVDDPKLVAQIILDVAALVGIFALIAIVLGIFLGAGRAAWQRSRNKSGLAEDGSSEFIRLNLK
ncbi:MAG TPA: DUF6599 family protein [Acidobacteriaceae bacterium]|nr:DUF6599 family protein [Acidobacteriaceae bacterium]